MSRLQATKNKLLVILGPTSSGKTHLAVHLAAEFNGEIISADSRQVYRGMDVGTGKDLKEYKVKSRKAKGKSLDIPYHLIDVADPKEFFDLARFKKLAEQAIEDILERGKLPILAGGTGLYLQAVVDDYKLSNIAADESLRKKLEKKTAPELYQELAAINKKFAEKLNNSDRHNKRRLIRYLEIQKQGGVRAERGAGKFDCLIIGLERSKKELGEKIEARLRQRLENEDLIGEVRRLHRAGVSWQRLESFGLEYRFVSRFLLKKIGYDEMFEQLNRAIRRFANRQLTWFRRWERQGKTIHWLKDGKQAETILKKFIKLTSAPKA